MIIFFIILLLCILVALVVKKNNKKSEVLLDCSNEKCQWNNNQPCPYKLTRCDDGNNGYRRKVEGINECCKTRQTRVKMAKIILDNKIETRGTQIIKNSKQVFERHKQDYPEEHKFLFGLK
ncbi:hypothetical protein PBI_SCTP2_377 [Salicola phage SCTP-2]|nr:hypothetical protein PBI_SCTP2_377 [Salicola phage SCTP-2]